MKKFKVRITEISSKEVEIEAKTKNGALAKAKKNWENAQYVFDEQDFDNVRYKIVD